MNKRQHDYLQFYSSPTLFTNTNDPNKLEQSGNGYSIFLCDLTRSALSLLEIDGAAAACGRAEMEMVLFDRGEATLAYLVFQYLPSSVGIDYPALVIHRSARARAIVSCLLAPRARALIYYQS